MTSILIHYLYRSKLSSYIVRLKMVSQMILKMTSGNAMCLIWFWGKRFRLLWSILFLIACLQTKEVILNTGCQVPCRAQFPNRIIWVSIQERISSCPPHSHQSRTKLIPISKYSGRFDWRRDVARVIGYLPSCTRAWNTTPSLIPHSNRNTLHVYKRWHLISLPTSSLRFNVVLLFVNVKTLNFLMDLDKPVTTSLPNSKGGKQTWTSTVVDTSQQIGGKCMYFCLFPEHLWVIQSTL